MRFAGMKLFIISGRVWDFTRLALQQVFTVKCTGSSDEVVLPLSLLRLALGYAFAVILLQIYLDKEEYADLALDFILPWNSRPPILNLAWVDLWGF